MVLLQAVGGLVVAVVVNYADNILKGFASSFSIITSCILCYFFYDFQPTILFALGAILVNVSMYVYSNNPVKEKDDKGCSLILSLTYSLTHSLARSLISSNQK